jgi:type I restriction enzyme R subunit
MPKTEAETRRAIDNALTRAGWAVQSQANANLSASRGVAIEEFPLATGEADYLLFVDGQVAGVVEAKREGETLTGVEIQSEKYSAGLPPDFPAKIRPLPFLFESNGVETRFTNRLDPDPRSRPLFAFPKPGWLAKLLDAAPASNVVSFSGISEDVPAWDNRATLRCRLRSLPPLNTTGLWPAQIKAVANLEQSLKANRPRALIQMATGSGKTFTAITAIYRLIKFGGAERVLFLVDRANLGRQALKEFQDYTTPDDGRKFTDLYNVQFLRSNKIDPVARVVITTIQRLYSMLQGEETLDESLEEGSQFDPSGALAKEPMPVEYNPNIPIEFFDVVFTDECHRSIYHLWRQVLEYFDAFLIGLTATPSKQTFGFFNQNLVMEYNHEQAVADGVNVDFDVYKIRTAITTGGSNIEAGYVVDRRDRLTRAVRWEKLEDEFSYDAAALDRSVVATDQIRTVVRTFKEKLPTEIFPGRAMVPKTLIFAKDDSHADDIVQIVREEFGKGNDFCQKITYKTTGQSPEDLLAQFRTATNPRIVVTVDMIATGTDVKPLEIVMFMRAVKSRNFFEQMKGRGVRVVDSATLRSVSGDDATSKTHFVIVDCVGVCEQELTDSPSLERNRTVGFDKLLNRVAFGVLDPDELSSLAGRLARLDRQLGEPDRQAIAAAANGQRLSEIASGIIDALDPDRQLAAARTMNNLPPEAAPTPEQLAAAKTQLLRTAAAPLAANPPLRNLLVAMKQRFEQTIDHLSRDAVLEAGFSADASERARTLATSFEAYLAEHKDEIDALQVLYSRPYGQRLRLKEIKELANAIQAPPRSWTTEALWRAYETLDKAKVRGSGGKVMADLVSLVRFATHEEGELVPYRAKVEARFAAWLAAQEANGRRFTAEQRQWLEAIRDQISASLAIEPDDFEYPPFAERGGLGGAYKLFGDDLNPLMDELNEVLAA